MQQPCGGRCSSDATKRGVADELVGAGAKVEVSRKGSATGTPWALARSMGYAVNRGKLAGTSYPAGLMMKREHCDFAL